MDELVDNVNELIRLGKGDLGRLTHIKDTLENKRTLFISDRKYVENLVSKHIINKEERQDLPEQSIIDYTYRQKFCSKCGTSLPDDSDFCVECGSPIKESHSASMINQQKNIVLEHKSPSKAWYLLPVFLIFIGGIIMYIKFRKKNKKMATSGLLIGFVITFIIVMLPSGDNSNTFSNSIFPQSEFEAMTLTREDLGTEWQRVEGTRYDDSTYFYSKAGIEFGEEGDMRQGAIYHSYGYMKGAGFDTAFLDIYIYRYETPEEAKAFYDQFLGIYKSEGGYNEWNTGVSGCYGGHVTGTSFIDKVAMYCLKGNVVTFLSSAGQEYDLEQNIPNIAKAINSKF